MRPWRAIVFLAALFVAGYLLMKPRRPSASKPAEGPVANLRPRPAPEWVLYAPWQQAALGVPARYAADLPGSVEELAGLDAPRYPPRAYVRDQLCAGDASMMQRFEKALAAAEKEAPAAKVADAFGALVRYCRQGDLCQVAAQRLSASGGSSALRRVLYAALADCERPEDRGLIDRPETPPEAVVAWYAPRRTAADAGFEPRLVDAVRALSQAEEAQAQALTYAAAVLGSSDDGRTAEAMLALHQQAKSPEAREAIAVGMYQLTDVRAVAAHRAACALEAHRRDPRCDAAEKPEAGQASAAPGASAAEPPLREQVRAWGFDPATFLAAHPGQKDELSRTLRACAAKLDACLRHLAAVDRPAAREAALRLGESCGRDLLETRNALVRFERPEALAAHLDSLKLVAASPSARRPDEPSRPPLTARDLLEQRGRVRTFDTETDQFPNAHDSLLRSLAALAGPALDTVVFEEVAPVEDQGDYTLHAYAGGQRYTVRAQNLGDWYDVEAVLGLLNSLCRERASAVRFVALPTQDQTAAVLAGDEAGLRALVSEGLLSLASAAEGMQNGKAFEDQVRQRLEGDGETSIP